MHADWLRKLVLFAVAMSGLAFSGRTAAAQGRGGIEEMLRRRDVNGNGMLEPEELEGSRTREMLKDNPQFDFSRPIPIDRFVGEVNRMRDQGMGGGDSGRGRPSFGGGGPPFGGGGPPFGGGGPSFGGGGFPWGGGGPPWGGDSHGRDSGRGPSGGDDSSPYRSRVTKVEPLVPGFGEVSMSTPPPGFGAEAELFTIPVTEDDRREAESYFGRLDRNRDGKIDAGEMRESRSGADLPMYDRNHDGVITMKEMEYRFARRRIENQQEDRARVGSSGGERRGDDRRRGEARDDGGEKPSNPTETKTGDHKSYRRKPPVERLPEGMPEWFARDDADGDGQVAMKEFSVSWTDAVLAEFHQFDMNRDGLITPQECLAAKNQGAVRGGSIGGSGSSPSPSSSPTGGMAVAVAPEAAAAAAGVPAASAPASGATPSSSASPAAANVEPRYYDYFKKVVIKYDSNNDGELTPNEWSSMSKNPEVADADRNGRITIEEYARWQMQR